MSRPKLTPTRSPSFAPTASRRRCNAIWKAAPQKLSTPPVRLLPGCNIWPNARRKDGRDVVVAGNPDHPEMIGVVGYAPDNTYVVRDASEVAALPQLRSPLVVSQTTIKLKTFLEVAEAVRAKADAEPQVVNTICSATRDRQDAARGLAGQVDVFYVIGGRHSSNSVKLLAVCQEQCEKSFLIETPAEINPADLENTKRVGVTAGASTPNWLIDQVVKRLHEIGSASA